MNPRHAFSLLITGAAAAAVVAGGPSTSAQGPGGFGSRPELEIADRFDANGDDRLDAVERAAARAFVESQAGPGGGFGGRGRGGMAAGTPGPRVDSSAVRPVPASVPFYDPGTVRTLFFEIDSSDWEAELMAFKSTDVEVPAVMAVDGRRYEDVGLSFRGNSSFSMVPAGLKHSLNVSVDFVHDGQNVLGYRTLNLLNGNGDPSLLRGVLFHDIAREYGMAARSNYARVVINGESWGVFVSVEQLNRDFFSERLNGDNGTRWKVPGSPGGGGGLEYLGDDAERYKRLYEIKNKDNRRSWDALINLARVLDTTPVAELERALSPILDVDGTLRFLALDNVLVNSDGYWTRGSDYFLYADEGGRFHVLPNDTNETFSSGGGRGGRGGRRGGGRQGAAPPVAASNPQAPSQAAGSGATPDLLVGLDDPGKPLRSKLLAVPALRAKYLAYCREIAETWLDWDRLGPAATRYHRLIAPFVEADTRKLASTAQFQASLDELRAFADARRRYVLAYEAR